jgi:ABC-type antimicrobial peptide transport system ATPase subunit
MTFKVYTASLRQNGPVCSDGSRSIVIGESEFLIYEGTAAGAIFALRQLGVGVSVAVRHPKGLRSCMNKPALWADIAAMAA